MASITRTTVWADAQVLTAAALNGEFNNSLNALNIVNADISSGAAIALSKLAGTFPASQIIVGTTDTQTLTNKTFTSPTITGTIAGSPTITKPTLNATVQALTTDTDGTTVTFDLSASNIRSVTLGGNRTLALSNVSVGQCFILRLIQDATGSRTVTWFSTIHWPGGSAPTLTTTASHWDTFGFVCTASNVFDGYIIGQNLS